MSQQIPSENQPLFLSPNPARIVGRQQQQSLKPKDVQLVLELAKRILDAYQFDFYEDSFYRLERKDGALSVTAKDTRGEIARLDSTHLSGNQIQQHDVDFLSYLAKTSEETATIIKKITSEQKYPKGPVAQIFPRLTQRGA